MQKFISQMAVAFVCLLMGLNPVHAKKSSKASGFGGMKTSPNLTITLKTGGPKGSAGKTRKTRKSGKRSGRHRKTMLPII